MTCSIESMKWYKRSRRSMNLAHAIEEQSAFGYAFDRFSCNCENDMSFWSSSSDIIPKHLALNISFASLLKSLPLFPRKPIIRGNTVHSGQKFVFNVISIFFFTRLYQRFFVKPSNFGHLFLFTEETESLIFEYFTSDEIWTWEIFSRCVMWWGDLEIWLKLFSLGCQFISFIKKLFRWIPTALCCCGWCTASLLSDINKSLLMNSDSCIELLRRKTRSVAMMYLVVISFKKTSLMCHHIHHQNEIQRWSKIVKNDNFSVF